MGDNIAKMAKSEGKENEVPSFVSADNMKPAALWIQRLRADPDWIKVLRVEFDGKENRYRVRLRLFTAECLNYHDYRVRIGADGKPCVEDVFIHANGEFVSETMSRVFFLALLVDVNRNLPKDSYGYWLAARKDHDATITQALRLANSSAVDAWKLIEKVPPGMDRDKDLLLLRLRVGTELGGLAFTTALRDFKAAFSEHPGANMFALRGNFNDGKWEAALANIDGIERRIGGDPMLDLQRAEVHMGQQDFKRAAKLARQAIDREPGLVSALTVLFFATLQQKDFAETAKLLTEMDAKGRGISGSLKADPVFADFVKSSHYQNWLKSSRPKK